jgi:hypothetical protein
MIGNVDHRVHHDQIASVIDKRILVMDVFDQNSLSILIIIAADSRISGPVHKSLTFVATSAASREDERLREYRVKRRRVRKPFETDRCSREEKVLQREAVEKIDVRKMKREVIPLPHSASGEENVVLLTADPTLGFPFRGEVSIVGQQSKALSPIAKGEPLGTPYFGDNCRRLSRRKRPTWATNISGDAGGPFERAIASRFMRLL